ncbi:MULTISPECIES: amino acid permease [unclassified Paenibacillus]|uniref:amino acid permease n=1 Tax=unclassified Paenibacillus TaxID=185978 RepID=UPI002780C285|nr:MULTISPECIES: amino acid permease [unclassified Paenibacillus]MDQ0897306.1 L-asparagine transporter-like permease [Paenibacillus sp. V4I7]MDQ0916548.1 L-asparagine transporter-like permease [Paenibacillus sp. V4I5]
MSTKAKSDKSGQMKWWQLSLLGVACTIGTGYFLGSGIGIKMGGGSVIFMFILAAIGTYIVFDVLARMTGADPQQGSFRAYAKKAYGRWAGFSSGWVYWSSELLIMGSQLTALSLFTRFWFPAVPMWIFATVYALIGLGVILLGTKAFERTEHVFAIIKVSAIVMFLLIAGAAVFGFITGGAHQPRFRATTETFLPAGLMGSWSSFIYAFYAFGGIEIMGLMATRLKRPEEAPKAGNIMILLLTTIYIASLILALTLIPLNALQGKESPFQVALGSYNLPFVPHAFNAILIIAGFSTMVASLFAVTTILITLAKDHDAPSIFAKKTSGKRKMPLFAIGFTTGGIAVAVLMALLLPEELYEYVTTAAGIMLLLNWLFILLSSGRLLQLSVWGKIKRYLGMALILTAITGTVFHETSRPGFWISLLFVVIIGLVTWGMSFKWKKNVHAASYKAKELPNPKHNNREGAT